MEHISSYPWRRQLFPNTKSSLWTVTNYVSKHDWRASTHPTPSLTFNIQSPNPMCNALAPLRWNWFPRKFCFFPAQIGLWTINSPTKKKTSFCSRCDRFKFHLFHMTDFHPPRRNLSLTINRHQHPRQYERYCQLRHGNFSNINSPEHVRDGDTRRVQFWSKWKYSLKIKFVIENCVSTSVDMFFFLYLNSPVGKWYLLKWDVFAFFEFGILFRRDKFS